MPFLSFTPSAPTDAQLEGALEWAAWCARSLGAPALPRVPTRFQRSEPLAATTYRADDMRSPLAWAGDLFARICSDCRAAERGLDLDPMPVPLPAPAEAGVFTTTLNGVFHPGAPGVVRRNLRNQPVCGLDMARVGVTGATARDCVLFLATETLVRHAPPPRYTADGHARAVLAVATHLGQGLELLRMGEVLWSELVEAGWMGRGDVAGARMGVELGTTLHFALQNLTPEQVLASYGPALEAGYRKRLPRLCSTLAALEPELKLIRRLADTGSVESNWVGLRATA